ncbi:fimbria/pilus outer membrane usher protein [Serratia symbiotica]|nr:fimbria/pilus outer membrane usher protein [Serratia symbiotica]
MGATVMLGEIFLASNLFDSWCYTGISLNSDECMLPPSLRGYAVAEARVVLPALITRLLFPNWAR